MNHKTAILLMAHGAPESLDEIPAYLTHIMKGRRPSDEIVAQIKERYHLIGDKSPLLEITKQQASALEQCLNQEGEHFQVYIGMRHWRPFISETVKQIAADQCARLIAISLAPQYSKLSVGAYIQTLEKALSESNLNIPVQMVKSWHDQAKLIQAFTEKIEQKLVQYDRATRHKVQVLFTAHSLPEEALSEDDPYADEVKATVSLIVGQLQRTLDKNHCTFAYQSQGFRPGKWLGPSVEKSIGGFGEAGKSELLVVPIGFVSDHVEILYDVDILYKGLAASQGIFLQRTDSLNTTPRFIEALKEVVYNNLSH